MEIDALELLVQWDGVPPLTKFDQPFSLLRGVLEDEWFPIRTWYDDNSPGKRGLAWQEILLLPRLPDPRWLRQSSLQYGVMPTGGGRRYTWASGSIIPRKWSGADKMQATLLLLTIHAWSASPNTRSKGWELGPPFTPISTACIFHPKTWDESEYKERSLLHLQVPHYFTYSGLSSEFWSNVEVKLVRWNGWMKAAFIWTNLIISIAYRFNVLRLLKQWIRP